MEKKIVLRSRKVTFLKTDNEKYGRMIGFTALTVNKNPEEYTRKYVDEDFESTDIVGMSTSIDYEFDQMEGNEVHEKLIDITDNEKLGDDAVVELVTVDFTKETAGGYEAAQRSFAVIPESDGDGTEAYKYSGTFRVKGPRIKGIASSDDGWKTCTFIEDDDLEI